MCIQNIHELLNVVSDDIFLFCIQGKSTILIEEKTSTEGRLLFNLPFKNLPHLLLIIKGD